MTRKSGKHLRTTHENTAQLFRPYQVSSAVYAMISTTGDQTSDHKLQRRNSTTEPQSISHTSDARFSGHGNSVHNIIPLLKKKKKKKKKKKRKKKCRSISLPALEVIIITWMHISNPLGNMWLWR